ncbi:Retrovirus-related Pol polyprotein from transposon TNT 1-94 [Sesamum angolense]|uniref:Retrovirus-related Pol polyprotein from transposon TNT 1-94 n=1 Tax=Sesamum angolense TaxID=2727404 RepID=A0AAE1T5S8_9LAMI|nr:Retrovirus-related Pol polyprotein from transposon TNT 1-94 [Sesamum angolense]
MGCVRKRNEQNEVVRYKARLVAQCFTQKQGIDYTETYSPVVDVSTLRFLINLSVIEQLKMQLMDMVTAYLYGSLDTDIYMRIPEGLKMLEALKSKPRHMYSIKLKRSLHGLKQSGRMWYNRLSEYLIKKGFCHNQISPCLFIKRTELGFVIIAVYVDDLNIIGSPEEIRQATDYLKSEFEMKDLGTTTYCLGLQFEHTKGGIFIHQSNYIEKVLKCFHMNNAHPLSTPMVVRSLDVNKDPFRPPTHNDEILGPEVPYLSAIGALMYLANNTRPDIAFSVNLLARYNSTPTKRHWNGVKHILRYLRGTSDMGLYFERHENAKATNLVGYSDAGYLSDPHKAISQSGYVFMCSGTAISWRSNQTDFEPIEKSPTVIYEDNAACIAQIKDDYIKGDRTKHISPKFFSTHELQVEGKVDVKQIPSSQSLADLFTKALPTKARFLTRQDVYNKRLGSPHETSAARRPPAETSTARRTRAAPPAGHEQRRPPHETSAARRTRAAPFGRTAPPPPAPSASTEPSPQAPLGARHRRLKAARHQRRPAARRLRHLRRPPARLAPSARVHGAVRRSSVDLRPPFVRPPPSAVRPAPPAPLTVHSPVFRRLQIKFGFEQNYTI